MNRLGTKYHQLVHDTHAVLSTTPLLSPRHPWSQPETYMIRQYIVSLRHLTPSYNNWRGSILREGIYMLQNL